MKFYFREAGAISTAVVALEIFFHFICRKMNEAHFSFIVQKHYFVPVFETK
jgi:hypothetical protein